MENARAEAEQIVGWLTDTQMWVCPAATMLEESVGWLIVIEMLTGPIAALLVFSLAQKAGVQSM